jgi:hypothetical protein
MVVHVLFACALILFGNGPLINGDLITSVDIASTDVFYADPKPISSFVDVGGEGGSISESTSLQHTFQVRLCYSFSCLKSTKFDSS